MQRQTGERYRHSETMQTSYAVFYYKCCCCFNVKNAQESITRCKIRTTKHTLLTKTNWYKNQKLKSKKKKNIKTAPSKGAITLPQIQLSLCCMLCYYTQYHKEKTHNFFFV